MNRVDEAEKKLKRIIAVLRDEHLLPELAFDLSSVAAALLVYITLLEKVAEAGREVVVDANPLSGCDPDIRWFVHSDYIQALEAALAALEKQEAGDE